MHKASPSAKAIIFAALLLALLAAALAISQQSAGGSQPQLKRVDISIIGISAPESNLTLGTLANITIHTNSTDPLAQYRLVVRENGEEVHSAVYNGTQAITLAIPIIDDGRVNITASLFLYDKKQFIDTDPSNEFAYAAKDVSPIVPMHAPRNASASN
ncbi:MAG: hypothetical protein N3H30_03100, partial [Candidatus Micrarchaeota archaeon]|nr:hypothetical protein [Candidatus Micrarchaeota archaeon]